MKHNSWCYMLMTFAHKCESTLFYSIIMKIKRLYYTWGWPTTGIQPRCSCILRPPRVLMETCRPNHISSDTLNCELPLRKTTADCKSYSHQDGHQKYMHKSSTVCSLLWSQEANLWWKKSEFVYHFCCFVYCHSLCFEFIITCFIVVGFLFKFLLLLPVFVSLSSTLFHYLWVSPVPALDLLLCL